MSKKLAKFHNKLDAIKKNNIFKLTSKQRKQLYNEVKRERLEKQRKEEEELKAKNEGIK